MGRCILGFRAFRHGQRPPFLKRESPRSSLVGEYELALLEADIAGVVRPWLRPVSAAGSDFASIPQEDTSSYRSYDYPIHRTGHMRWLGNVNDLASGWQDDLADKKARRDNRLKHLLATPRTGKGHGENHSDRPYQTA